MFTSDTYYRIIATEELIHFYKVKKSNIQKMSRKGHARKSTEEAPPYGKQCFSLPVSSITSVVLCGEKSPWNRTNMGTVEITVDGQIKKFLISYLMDAGQVEAFFISAGCKNVTVTKIDEQLHAQEPSLRGKKARKISRRLARFKGLWSSTALLLLFWIFFIPNVFDAGVIILFILTLFSMAVFCSFQAYFVATAVRKNRSENFWTNLLSSAILPPFLLIIVLLQSFDFSVPPAVYIVIPIAALLITTFSLLKFKRLRNRTMAITMAFFAAAILFSAVLGANYLFQTAILKNNTGIVEEMTVKRSTGYRHRSYSYYVTVSFVPDRYNYKKVKVPQSVYRTLQTGMTVRLSMRRGIFNINWYQLDSY